MDGPTQMLDTVLYSRSLAATYVGMDRRALDYWLDGGSESAPTAGEDIDGEGDLTWGQFVQSWFVRRFQDDADRLKEIRAAVEAAAAETGLKYPLAFKNFYVTPGSRLAAMQRSSQNSVSWGMLALNRLTSESDRRAFLEKVDFDEATAAALSIHPRGRNSAVAIDPRVSFGAPQAGGVRTENLAELACKGESVAAIAKDFELDPKVVEDAIDFESQFQASTV